MAHPNRFRYAYFRPYQSGPTFSVELYDVRSLERIGYALRQHERGKTTVLFEGRDFRPSPLHAWDSDATIEAVLGFLTLRPGDTDAEYFFAYTPAQRAFCEEHAEALWMAVYDRFVLSKEAR
jgi:hypothetical protein